MNVLLIYTFFNKIISSFCRDVVEFPVKLDFRVGQWFDKVSAGSGRWGHHHHFVSLLYGQHWPYQFLFLQHTSQRSRVESKYEQLCTYDGVLLHPGFNLLHLPWHHTWEKGGVCSFTKEQIFSWNLNKSELWNRRTPETWPWTCECVSPELDLTMTLILLLTESKFKTWSSSNLCESHGGSWSDTAAFSPHDVFTELFFYDGSPWASDQSKSLK